MTPLSFISGLGWKFKAALIAVVAIASFSAGWKVHSWKTDAAVANGIAKQTKVIDRLEKPRADNIKDKAEKTQRIQYVYKTITKEINALDDDRVCFTADSLKLWNSAIAGADTHRREPAGAASQDDAADAEDQSDNAEVVATVKEVLANAADNYETCNKNSVKHQTLINEIRLLQPNMCVCAQ